MSKHSNCVAARDALWQLIAKHAAGIKKDFINGNSGMKSIDAMEKGEREKGFGWFEKALRAKTNMSNKADATPKKVVVKVGKKAAAKATKTARAVSNSKTSAAASALSASLDD